MSSLERVYAQIAEMAREHGLERVVLFGSRARGTALPKSDIDLAVVGGDANGFVDDVQSNLWSLLHVDVVVLDNNTSPSLRSDILRDGKVLYEAL